jgi:hypothetical protein
LVDEGLVVLTCLLVEVLVVALVGVVDVEVGVVLVEVVDVVVGVVLVLVLVVDVLVVLVDVVVGGALEVGGELVEVGPLGAGAELSPASKTLMFAVWPLGTVTTQKAPPPAPSAASLEVTWFKESDEGSILQGRPLQPAPSSQVISTP